MKKKQIEKLLKKYCNEQHTVYVDRIGFNEYKYYIVVDGERIDLYDTQDKVRNHSLEYVINMYSCKGLV